MEVMFLSISTWATLWSSVTLLSVVERTLGLPNSINHWFHFGFWFLYQAASIILVILKLFLQDVKNIQFCYFL